MLALNVFNGPCLTDNSCDNELYVTGWSQLISETQPSATPDAATDLTQELSEINQTAMLFRWTPPNPSGEDVLEYRIVCTDVSSYVESATLSWMQPIVTTLGDPRDPAVGQDAMWVQGLVPGTTYTCVLSSRNSIGG